MPIFTSVYHIKKLKYIIWIFEGFFDNVRLFFLHKIHQEKIPKHAIILKVSVGDGAIIGKGYA